MTTNPDEPRDTGKTRILPNEFPLRFRDHSFQVICYNTIGCTVFYYKKYQTQHAPDKVAPPPINADYRKYWGSMEIAIPNFPPPAIVKWKSLDGVFHEAEVDIGGIFKDQLILHNVLEADIPEGWAHDISPDIFLEVNGRTINVYMAAHIATKQVQEPGNRFSDFRNDLILAWSHTY